MTVRRDRVLLCVSGGIAAFKACLLTRQLRQRGLRVRIALTRAAESFVTPLTLEVLSGFPVYRDDYLGPGADGDEPHITASDWADVVCLAPATANSIAKTALGLADDFTSTTVAAFDGPLVIAPAMHPRMWNQHATTSHIRTLRERGAVIVGPDIGPLASGEEGIGRLAEPETIADAIEAALATRRLEGRRIVVSAGPTREMLDPVRFLSNRSSGKMGFALAAAAVVEGAKVWLVAGPVQLPTPYGVERIDVLSALEMREEVLRLAPEADLVVMTAAVSDFRPREVSEHKIKKQSGLENLALERNPDILAELRARAPRAVLVGFSAETQELAAEAGRKLMEKGTDFVVGNDISRPDIGFDSDCNEVTVFRQGKEPVFLSRRPKLELAKALMQMFLEDGGDEEAEGHESSR